jgi:hypothetical protein
MATDLLDFTWSAAIAAFFALGGPRPGAEVSQKRAAVFVIRPDDIEALPKLPRLPPSLNKVAQMYEGAFQGEPIEGLSRLIAQNGVFVRDVGGSFESLTDEHFSMLPVLFENEVGRRFLLRKYSFVPKARDVATLERLGVSFERIYPPPNDLEREVGRFSDWWMAVEYERERRNDDSHQVIKIDGRKLDEWPALPSWSAPRWENWSGMNLSTEGFALSEKRQKARLEVPREEFSREEPSPTLRGYVEHAMAEGAAFASRYELHYVENGEVRRFPSRANEVVEVLSRLPYGASEIELALRKALQLYLESRNFPGLPGNTPAGDTVLARTFGGSSRWLYLDLVCFEDGHCVQTILPAEALTALPSMQHAAKVFQTTAIAQEYTQVNVRESPLLILYHRPMFRALILPEVAIRLWSSFVIPWQIRYGPWDAAVLNPFLVEFFGLN